MAFSLITDIIWIIYWGASWNSFNNREIGMNMFVLIVSIIEFLVKVITVIVTFAMEPECKAAITDLPHNAKNIMKPPGTGYGEL